MDNSAGAHDAWLERADESHAVQAIIPNAVRGLAQSHDFRVTCRIVGRDGMIVPTSHDRAICSNNHSAYGHFPRSQGCLRLLQGLPHQFVIHHRMLNYQAMKSLRGLGLAFVLMLLPLPGFGQGVRMSADFLPLEVGKQWTYDVTNEAGNKLGQISFAVEDYTIVSGASFYVLSEFPFSVETEPIRFIRYDRGERYFIRKAKDNEGPLFLDDSATTEVIEADSSGAPQKFVLRTGEVSLTFQRGVGIVEARMKRSGTPVIARLVASPVASGTRPSVPTAAAPTDKSVLIPPPVTPNRREPPVAAVSAQNPRLEVSATPTPDGYRFVIIATNTSDKLLPLRFTSGQTYDFVIRDTLGDREVWRWSNGNFFAQVIRNESIRAEGKWQFDVTWNRKDNDDKPVPAGAYRLTAIVTSSPLLQVSIPLNIP